MVIKGKLNSQQIQAINFFASVLFTPQMCRFVGIDFKFIRRKVPWLGMVNIDDYNLKDKPREFTIEVNSNQSPEEIIKTIAHEMVHVKQYVYDELDEEGLTWLGVSYDPDLDYDKQPWEIEAHDVTDILYETWLQHKG